MDLKTTLDQIIHDQDYDALDRLLSNGLDPNAMVESGDRLIHVLALNGDPEFLKILFKYNFDPNLLTDYYETAIMMALENRDGYPFETVKVLLDMGVDPTLVDFLGEHALHKATMFHYYNIVKLLLDYGMDINSKNNKGKTALDIANDKRYDDIKQLLLTHTGPHNEVLINHIHFIWLGSSLNEKTAKNIPKWVATNKDCGFDIYIWYDSKLITREEEEVTHDYVNSLGENLLLCDIRKYDIMNIAINNDVVKTIEAYNYESGIWPRAQVNPEARKIVNWGFASDVLRMLILYKYQGFYMDLDMEPIRLCEYFADKRIKSCPIRFCMTNYMESEVVDYDVHDTVSVIDTNNNALYYDGKFDTNSERMKSYFTNVAKNYEWLKNDYYYYLLFYFIRGTILTSGPFAIRRLLATVTNNDKYAPRFDRNSNYVLRLFKEDPSVASISWAIKKYDVLSILLNDLFKDHNELMRCYYKTFGTEFYDLTLIESNWLTQILDSVKHLHGDREKLYLETKKLVQENSDLLLSLPEGKINNLVALAVMLKSTYDESSVYPSPSHCFIIIVTALFTRQFLWNGDDIELDSITSTISDRLIPMSHKRSETIDPNFFASLLEYVSLINSVHNDESMTRMVREISYNKYYDLIEDLVDKYLY